MDQSDLAKKMLTWERLQREADALRAEIEAGVLALGRTQVVGNVRATFNNPRRTYQYEAGFKAAWATALDKQDIPLLNKLEKAVDAASAVKVDWREVCAGLEIEAPYTTGEPSVTVKLEGKKDV